MPQIAPKISFTTKLFAIGDWIILQLPSQASAKLNSRGQVIVDMTINGYQLHTPLEPDGKWSHWLKLDDDALKASKANAGDSVRVQLQASKDWPEPVVPADIQTALKSAAAAQKLWHQVTPMARWEWIRWVRSTGRAETRQHRIEVAMSKLTDGKRRPCCWNRNLSTEPSVSKNGILCEPVAD